MKTTSAIIILAFSIAIIPSCALSPGSGVPSVAPSAGIGDIFNLELNLTQTQIDKTTTLLLGLYLGNQSDITKFLKYAQPFVQALTAKTYSKSNIEQTYKKYSKYEKKMMVLLGKFYVDFYKILDNKQKKIMDDNVDQLLKILKNPLALMNLFSSLPIENENM